MAILMILITLEHPILCIMTRTEKFIRVVAGNFWLRNALIFMLLVSSNTGVPLALGQLSPRILLIEAILMTNSYGSFLLHNLVLYRYLLKRRRYLLYILSLFSLLLLSSQFYALMKDYFYGESSDYPLVKWIAMFWVEAIYYWGALGVYLAYTYYRDRERLFQVEQQKKELELQQLNEQLNPHFLFNALNNIYSHLLTQSGQGKELILKLSELMRYVLDSNKKVQVPLTEEIAFIEHYLAFEQERLGYRCQLHYEKTGIMEDTCIIPLILFTFIENAFKHGTSVIKHSEISIRIQAEEQLLRLFVRNEIHRKNKASTHTGLQNTRRRLELLYPDQYRLDIEETNNHYTVNLELYNLSCYSVAS